MAITNPPHWKDPYANKGFKYDKILEIISEMNSPTIDHATRHQDGGTDEINVAALSGLLADAQNPLAHKTSHQDGGTDELSVAGLSGLLADAQTPLNAVLLTGDQSVAGIKTFSSIPVLPASNPTTDNQAARKEYVDSTIQGTPAAYAYHTADIAINSAWLPITTLTSEKFDNNAIHDTSTNSGRLTCKTTGVYQITAIVVWEPHATGFRWTTIRLNGAGGTFISNRNDPNHGASFTVNQNVTCLWRMVVNDYVEIVVNQTSGGSLDVQRYSDYSPSFAMAWVSEG